MDAKKLGKQRAFPCPESPKQFKPQGMTLRQWYAGQAMRGLLANPDLSDNLCEEFARMAVAQADALLAELAKERTE